MYSDNPRYYQPPPPSSSRQQSFTPSELYHSFPSDHQSAQSHVSRGAGRYGGGLGVTHNQVYSPTPHRVPSGRMRAWADEEVLAGNTAQTGFQSAAPPHLLQHVQRQQRQQQQQPQWGHAPRHSLAGALSPGIGAGTSADTAYTGQSRSDLPRLPSNPRQPSSRIAGTSSTPFPHLSAVPTEQSFTPLGSWYNSTEAQSMAPLNPRGTNNNGRRSSLAQSATGSFTDGAVGVPDDGRSNGRSRNKRKNQRRDDEGELGGRLDNVRGVREKGGKRKGQGPPPKAKLGGPGGDTYDERQKRKPDGGHAPENAGRESQSGQQVVGVGIIAAIPGVHAEEVENVKPMYKDRPIEIRLPPSRTTTQTSVPLITPTDSISLSGAQQTAAESQASGTDITLANEVPLPASPAETQVNGPFEAGWDGQQVKVALPSVPEPAVRSISSTSEPWLPGPMSQTDKQSANARPTSLEASIRLDISRRDTFGHQVLSPVFTSPAAGPEDLGGSPSTIGRTRENSTSEYQATISRAAFLRPSAPAFMPASRIFERTVTSPMSRNEINELPAASPMQQRVVSDNSGGDGPRKKLRPSAPSFTPSHASSRSRTSTGSSISHSRLEITARTFSPKRGLASLPRAEDLNALVPLKDGTSTPGLSSRPSMSKVATSPSPARGTLRAAAPSFMPVDQGIFTFKPPTSNKGRPSLMSAFEPPGTATAIDDGTDRSMPNKDSKGGYLGGLGSGMSMPLKPATSIELSPSAHALQVQSGRDPAAHAASNGASTKIASVSLEQPQISPALASDDKFGSMSASQLFFKPPDPTPAIEQDDFFSAFGITHIESRATSSAGRAAAQISDAAVLGEEPVHAHRAEPSYDSGAEQLSGYVEDLGASDDEEYGDAFEHGGSSDIEPDEEEANVETGAEEEGQIGSVRAHLPTESFGLPSPVVNDNVQTVGGRPLHLPSLQHVPRYIPADQPLSPTTPIISESPLQNQPTGLRSSCQFAAPETPHKTLEGEQDMQIPASPTPARRVSSINDQRSLTIEADKEVNRGQIWNGPAHAENPLPQPSESRPSRALDEHTEDDARFRNWVFPTPDKAIRPSIGRRYTMPLRDIATAPVYSEQAMNDGMGAGVASTTLQERLSELRDVLGGRLDNDYGYQQGGQEGQDVFGTIKLDRPKLNDGDRQPSVEFPTRPKTLKVVNATPKRQSLAAETQVTDGHLAAARYQQDVLGALKELQAVLGGLARKQNEQEDVFGVKQILATIEGMRGDVLQTLHRRGHEKEQDRYLQIELSSLRQQLSTQSDRFDALSVQLRQESTMPDATSRTDEMFTALLSGQHAMLDRFTTLTEDRDIEGKQLAEAVDALEIARAAANRDKELVKKQDDLIHSLRQKLAEARVQSRQNATERDELRAIKNKQHASESALAQKRLELQSELDMAKKMSAGLEDELVDARGALHAAEAERDALAAALGEAHGCRGDLERDVVDLRHQVQIERQKPSVMAPVPQNDMSAQISEFVSSNKVFQDDLFAQIAFLQKDIVEAREAHRENAEEMAKEQSTLRERIRHLENDLDEAKARATRSEIQAITEAEHNMAIQTVLDSELSTALAEREEARSKVADLETVARSLREEKENATMVATERSGAMRQVEARLAALSQENVYWRQFALSYDRREYRQFLGNRPTHGLDDNVKHGAVGETAHHGTTQGSIRTPTRSPVLQTPHHPDGGATQTFLTPTSNPLNANKGKAKAAPSTGTSSLQATPDLSASTSTAQSTRPLDKQ